MLMTKNTAHKFTCPLSMARGGEPSACIGSKCASWRLYVTPLNQWVYSADDLPLGYCGQAHKPALEQIYIQLPELFDGTLLVSAVSLADLRRQASSEAEKRSAALLTPGGQKLEPETI